MKKAFAVLAAFALSAAPQAGNTQSFEGKTITIVVGFKAGGG
jgi:tripartite-type tricarboxylate transporter receptor subunit TctC